MQYIYWCFLFSQFEICEMIWRFPVLLITNFLLEQVLTVSWILFRRSVLVREAADAGGAHEDITPAGFNVRTLVHEYGGGAFTVSGDVVVFSNFKDQRLYKQSIKGGTFSWFFDLKY